MKIRYEMTDRNPGTKEYESPDDLLIREASTGDIGHAVDMFNEFVRGVWGPGWGVMLMEAADESDDD